MLERDSVLKHLQRNVEKQFDKQICTATDCEKLGDLIKNKLSGKISAQTLRRFFGLIKYDSGYSIYTLDLLSKFCGFQDFKTFNDFYNTQELVIFFAATENNDKDFWRKSEQLCEKISDSAELLVSTHHRLMSFPNVRKYFIENHPLRDMIGTVYSQYFLAYLKFNQTNEAKIFAYGFLFQSAFLLQNTELMDLYYNKVKDTELTENVHVIPAGLKYGVQLLYADFKGNSSLFRKYFAEMKKVRLQYIKVSEKSVCSFEYTVLESLIFTNRTKEMKFLMDHHTFQIENDQDFIPLQRQKTHETVWNILCAAAYQKMDDHKNTELYFNLVNLDNLGVGWKNYYSLLYYFVQLKDTDHHQEMKTISKLKTLINKTFFSYYDDLFNNLFETSEKEKKQFGHLKEIEHSAVEEITVQV